MPDYELEVELFPMADTGIGKACGYESDQALLDHGPAWRATLPPGVREALEGADREMQAHILGVSDGPSHLEDFSVLDEEGRETGGVERVHAVWVNRD